MLRREIAANTLGISYDYRESVAVSIFCSLSVISSQYYPKSFYTAKMCILFGARPLADLDRRNRRCSFRLSNARLADQNFTKTLMADDRAESWFFQLQCLDAETYEVHIGAGPRRISRKISKWYGDELKAMMAQLSIYSTVGVRILRLARQR